MIEGGQGDDIINGGAGIDTASYASSVSGVVVSLAIVGAQDTGSAGFDTLISIENLTGGHGNDVLTGNSGANIISGGGGVDTVTGGGGADRFAFATGDIVGVDGAPANNVLLRDVISDFTKGSDKIDFHLFDAKSSTLVLDHFHFIGAFADQNSGALPVAEFLDNATDVGGIRYHFEDVGGVQHTIIDLNTMSGNTTAEYQIDLLGHIVLTASDFVF